MVPATALEDDGGLAVVAWYTLPGVVFDAPTIAGRKVARAAFSLYDGELGDDTAVDGEIVDQGGPSLPIDNVPVSGRTLALMALLLALLGAGALRRS